MLGFFLSSIPFLLIILFCFFLQIKEKTEKTNFFSKLTPCLDSFPPSFCKNKILPQLLNAFEYGDAGSSVLAPLFKVRCHETTNPAKFYQRINLDTIDKLNADSIVNLTRLITLFQFCYVSYFIVNNFSIIYQNKSIHGKKYNH